MRPRSEDLVGPVRASLDDIDALNQLFSESFTDRYHRDGMSGVRVPHLNRDVWQYSLEDAGAGAMLWRDAGGALAAFNLAHRSGIEGWMGPLAVRPTLQGRGIGQRIVSAGISWLRQEGATAIGLETMPRTVDNIGFYTTLGFRPGHLTVSLARPPLGAPPEGVRSLRAAGADREPLVAACAGLAARLMPGVDYTRELELTERLALGDTTVMERGEQVVGFALWHSAPLAAGRSADEARVLKLVAEDLDVLCQLLEAVGTGPGGRRVDRIAVRCQTAYPEVYRALVADGFRAQWTDLRMLLEDTPERPPRGIVFSNWEI